MNAAPNDFVSREPRDFRFMIGHAIASSLSGVIAGIVIASMFWLVGIWYVSQLQTTFYTPSPATVCPQALQSR